MRTLFKNALMASVAILLASPVIAEEKRWTLEEAVKSHQQNVGERASRGVDHNKGFADWNSRSRVPDPLESGSNSNEKYVVLFQGECTVKNTCALTENIMNFATIIVGANNRDGRLNTSAFPTAGLIGRELNMSTSTRGEGNDLIHLKFPSRTTIQYVGEYFTGTITDVWGINKQPPEAAECTTGQLQNENIYCESPQKTCETGTKQKSCSSGFWSPASIINNPICVAQNRNCP